MRLIDADALIDFIDLGHLRSPSEICFSEFDVVDMLEDCATVDAVEVVRCKDCKWWHTHNCRVNTQKAWTEYDAYCPYGERKEVSE